MMRNEFPFKSRHRGFSLIEVLIAVVILSTGLLALAALQGSLTKASADAKVRSQVASLLQSRMDRLRTVGYAGATPGVTIDSCAINLGANDFVPQAFCDQNGLGAMQVTQTITTWTGAVGGSSFAVGTPGSADDPQFKRVVLAASWTDASGVSTRRLAMSTDVSGLGLGDNIVVPPGDSNIGGQNPIVRQASPATAGVIPIAFGSDATAATNPRPEVMGRNNNQSIVGTNFNVLTYTNESTSTVRIQRRIENSLIHCKCQYGAAGSNFSNLPEISRVPQWPAVWTGERYDIFVPNPAALAPGTAFKSAPVANETQSPLCTECCRDHHATSLSGAGRYDPERTDGVGRYGLGNQGDLTTSPVNTTNGIYVNACRVIRVDGFWRASSDTYARHFGLLATETPLKPGATGVPEGVTTAPAYQVFVKDFLDGYRGTPTPAPGTADTLFNQPARGLNNPPTITINRPTPKDERYLHGRGVYVDFLEQKARDKLAFALNNCTTTPAVECILPYLPFTTINVTELAFWQPQVGGTLDRSILTVTSGSSLVYDPLQPSRGRTNARASATNGATADAVALMGKSNAGLAIASGVDPGDEALGEDRQTFIVAAPGTPGVSERFDVRLSNLPQLGDANTSNDPAVAWITSAPGGSGNCDASIKLTSPNKDLNPNDYLCFTTGALGIPASVVVANYGRASSVTRLVPATCSNGTATATISIPTFENYRVSTVAGGIGGSIQPPDQYGRTVESTTIKFISIAANDLIQLGFALEGTAEAGIESCTTNAGRNQINDVVWSKSWCPIVSGNTFEGCRTQ